MLTHALSKTELSLTAIQSYDRLSRQCGVKSIIDYIPKMVGYGADHKLLCFHKNQPCA